MGGRVAEAQLATIRIMASTRAIFVTWLEFTTARLKVASLIIALAQSFSSLMPESPSLIFFIF
jgi:hypothetical protein